jgi:hypothetical protein
LATPIRNSPTTSSSTPTWEPAATSASATASSTAIEVTVRREPKRAMSGPDAGSATTDPAAMDSSTSPSSEGPRSRWLRTCGMREAQLAKAKPEPMNAA